MNYFGVKLSELVTQSDARTLNHIFDSSSFIIEENMIKYILIGNYLEIEYNTHDEEIIETY